MDLNQLIVTVISVLFGGSGLWAWLQTSRTATTEEYDKLFKTLQKVREDLEADLKIVRKDVEHERQARLEQTLLIMELVTHIMRLERLVKEAGGTVPERPHRLQEYITQNHL